MFQKHVRFLEALLNPPRTQNISDTIMKLALPLLTVTALGLEKGQYQTPLECVDVCPTNETNWRNNPTCKLEDLGVCKCVFEGKECIFYYNGGKWTQVCQDSKGKDPPLSNYCSNVCLESMPEYVNDTACNLEALMGCNYEYSNNSEYFFSCMDGKWKMACFGGNRETLPTRDANFETSPECVNICPVDDPNCENIAICDLNVQEDCDCVYENQY